MSKLWIADNRSTLLSLLSSLYFAFFIIAVGFFLTYKYTHTHILLLLFCLLICWQFYICKKHKFSQAYVHFYLGNNRKSSPNMENYRDNNGEASITLVRQRQDVWDFQALLVIVQSSDKLPSVLFRQLSADFIASNISHIFLYFFVLVYLLLLATSSNNVTKFRIVNIVGIRVSLWYTIRTLLSNRVK